MIQRTYDPESEEQFAWMISSLKDPTLYAENPYFRGHFFVRARIYFQAIIMRILKLIRHFEAAE